MNHDITKYWRVTVECETGDIGKRELIRLLKQRTQCGDGIYVASQKSRDLAAPKVEFLRKIKEQPCT